MPKTKNGNAKKRGRPATGRDPQVVVRLPRGFLHAIDDWADAYEGLDRSAAIRSLIALGLSFATQGKQRDRAVCDGSSNYRDYTDPKYRMFERARYYRKRPKLPMVMPEPEPEPEVKPQYEPAHPVRVPKPADIEAAVQRALARSEAQRKVRGP